jgi:hypothetical protein
MTFNKIDSTSLKKETNQRCTLPTLHLPVVARINGVPKKVTDAAH